MAELRGIVEIGLLLHLRLQCWFASSAFCYCGGYEPFV